MQSGIDARELGLKVTILADACATTDPALAELALRYAAEVGGCASIVAPSGAPSR